ncbi:uncharacterized protein VTP21DRAFT_7411 [Calcarisporiella thermophila]|uniref:uncharacterized protein n=1 Tax=Calcarisporiella thermophila TaxID=911321 RepID=UPI0037438065
MSRSGSLKKLKFSLPLVSSSSISTTELISRLKRLNEELSSIEQGEINIGSLKRITNDLVHRSLISHKDKRVRSLVACSLADLLRLYAPEAPYKETTLKRIFEFFFEILRDIRNPSNPNYENQLYLLESLSTVKSVVLIADLDDADQMIVEVFRDFFDIMSPQLPEEVRKYMSDILELLIEECAPLPQDAVVIILAQFLKKRQQENPVAYQLAAGLCRACTDRLQRYIGQYFSEVILNAIDGEISEDDLREFRVAHDLILELNRVAPGLLLNVIPQLEEEMRVDDMNLRGLSTRVLGGMFGEPGSMLAFNYPTTWKTWLQRKQDKNSAIRQLWCELCIPILKNHPNLSKDICDALLDKVLDPDEKIRATVCKLVGQLEYMVVLQNVDELLLQAVGKRCKDRRHPVQQEAIKACGRLYNLAYTELAAGNRSVMKKFDWILSALMDVVYTNDAEAIACLEKSLQESVFPLDNNDDMRTERLLVGLSLLDPKSRKGFTGLLNKQRVAIKEVKALIQTSEQLRMVEKEEKLEHMLDLVIKHISDKLPDRLKAASHLAKLSAFKDKRVFRLMRECMNPEADYRTVRKAGKEVLRSVEEHEPSISDTVGVLLRRASYLTINKSIIPCLVKVTRRTAFSEGERVSEEETRREKLAEVAHELLKDISLVFPEVYRSHKEELVKLLREEKNEVLLGSLEAMSHFVKAFPHETPQDEASRSRLVEIALDGPPEHAKHAAVILANLPDKESVCNNLLDEIVPKLSLESEHMLVHLTVIAQLVLHAPEVYEKRNEQVLEFLVHHLLRPSNPPLTKGSAEDTGPPNGEARGEGEKENGEGDEDDFTWVSEAELDPIGLAKCLALKILVNLCLAYSGSKAAPKVARRMMEWLWQLVNKQGELVPKSGSQGSTPPLHRAHLRLRAARSLLKLARVGLYDRMINVEQFELLALTIHDVRHEVRSSFVNRLIKYLGARLLRTRWMAILPLIAVDPDKELREHVKKFLQRESKTHASHESTTSHLPYEITLARTLHLLAHHPDFSTTEDVLHQFAKCIEFYLDCFANGDNVSCLFEIAARIKTTRDIRGGEGIEGSKNVYALSELAQIIIKHRCRLNSWSLTSYIGHIELPKDFFVPIQDEERVRKLVETTFLPSGVDIYPTLGDKAKGERMSRYTAAPAPPTTPSKKRSKTYSPRATKRQRSHAPSESVRKNASRVAKLFHKSYAELSDEEGEESEEGNEAIL